MRDAPLRLLKSKSKAARTAPHKSVPVVVLRKFKSSVYGPAEPTTDGLFGPKETEVICAVDVEKLSKTDRAYHDVLNRVSVLPDSLTRTGREPDLPAGKDPARPPPCEDGRFCICERPYMHGELMFKCEGYCANWYHPRCLGMQDAEVEKHCKKEERWYCADCYQRAYSLVLSCSASRK